MLGSLQGVNGRKRVENPCINRYITVVDLFLISQQLPITLAFRARTSDSIIGTGTVLALLMNRDTMISVLYIAQCSTL